MHYFLNSDVVLTDAQYNEEIRTIKRDDKKIAFFDEHGVLIDVFPRNKSISLYEDRQTAYSADFFVMNGKIYDLHNPSDVKSIEVPDFIFNGDVTSGIEYLMYMHKGNENNPELELAVVNKAFDLMANSKWGYTKKDYITLAICLMKIDRFDKADELYNKAQAHLSLKRAEYFTERVKEHDLIFCSPHENTCEICSMYQNRVYSVSGEDKRFPKLPDMVFRYQGFHPGCRHSFFPYYYPYVNTVEKYVMSQNGEINIECYDAVEYSNRPFVDERTEEEKKNHIKRLQKKDIYSDYEYAKEHYMKRKIQLDEYKLIKKNLPKLAPKSFSGYSRMKSMNTKNYQKILALIKEKGIEI
ncbi:MAG: hypothetical protein J6K64_04325 [Clostridia bacterium]|nr:hypothetical protein [Clostridia bacterium]